MTDENYGILELDLSRRAGASTSLGTSGESGDESSVAGSDSEAEPDADRGESLPDGVKAGGKGQGERDRLLVAAERVPLLHVHGVRRPLDGRARDARRGG